MYVNMALKFQAVAEKTAKQLWGELFLLQPVLKKSC